MRNEGMARSSLVMIANAQTTYRDGEGNGNYATLDQLFAAGMVPKDFVQNNGYRVELTINGEKFEAIAVPLEYGKSGKLSYFIDQSKILHGADRGGAPATSADPEIR